MERRKYYHASKRLLRGRIKPEGLYEEVGASGCPEPIYMGDSYIGFPHSDVGESCFSKSIAGALTSVAATCLKEGKCTVHIYETGEEPDVDLSDCWNGDFHTLEEVRYRRPVKVRHRRKVIIPPETLRRFRHDVERLELVEGINPETWDNLMKALKRSVRKRL